MIIAWIALGLVLFTLILGFIFLNLVEKFQGEVLETIEEIRRLLKGQPDDEYTPLTEEQRRELRVVWANVACMYCGFLHPGLCPRLQEIRYLANGNQERIIFWPDGEWAVPKGAHSYREVFGDVVPQAEGTT